MYIEFDTCLIAFFYINNFSHSFFCAICDQLMSTVWSANGLDNELKVTYIEIHVHVYMSRKLLIL